MPRAKTPQPVPRVVGAAVEVGVVATRLHIRRGGLGAAHARRTKMFDGQCHWAAQWAHNTSPRKRFGQIPNKRWDRVCSGQTTSPLPQACCLREKYVVCTLGDHRLWYSTTTLRSCLPAVMQWCTAPTGAKPRLQ